MVLPLMLMLDAAGENFVIFCAAHQQEVDAYVACHDAELERLAAMPPGHGVRKIRSMMNHSPLEKRLHGTG